MTPLVDQNWEECGSAHCLISGTVLYYVNAKMEAGNSSETPANFHQQK